MYVVNPYISSEPIHQLYQLYTATNKLKIMRQNLKDPKEQKKT